ncbi:unnamed protein product [Arabidopsis thaliana]|uniref:Uncharacterized protein n=1 Tax=Arabidopsis thaliana TaxID=3702 RepID=A0A654EKK3_ARATH|nr:unnamed protein product [Arabidopsis thaliana]
MTALTLTKSTAIPSCNTKFLKYPNILKPYNSLCSAPKKRATSTSAGDTTPLLSERKTTHSRITFEKPSPTIKPDSPEKLDLDLENRLQKREKLEKRCNDCARFFNIVLHELVSSVLFTNAGFLLAIQ